MKRVLHNLFFLAIFFLTSCASYEFSPVNQGGQLGREMKLASLKTQKQNLFTYKIETESLLWGTFPSLYKIETEDLLKLSGHKNMGGVSIKRYQSLNQKVLSFISLGIYLPETIEVSFWGEYVIGE